MSQDFSHLKKKNVTNGYKSNEKIPPSLKTSKKKRVKVTKLS